MQRYRRLRAYYPGYRQPRPDAAEWAAAHEAELCAAVTAVVAYRDTIAAEGLMRGQMVSIDDLASLAAAGDPAVLYWAAYAATSTEFIYGQATTAGRAVAALQDLVTEPPQERQAAAGERAAMQAPGGSR
jgi:hypothetical protein